MPKVLYIDDDPGNRLLVKKILTRADFEFHEAETGIGGLEQAKEIIPDLILMDMSLPDFDGYAATTRIKSMPQLQHTRIVALTGQSMKGDRERALAAGCDGYIPKPISIPRLAGQVRSYLDGHQEQLEQGREQGYLREYSQKLVERLEQKVRELSSVNSDLEQRVADKAKELQAAQEQLLQAEKMASIGQLSAGVAHEINNPIGYVSSNIDTMARYAQDLVSVLDQYELAESTLAERSSALEEIHAHRQKMDLDFIKQDLPALIRESQEGIGRVKAIIQDLKHFSHAGSGEWECVNLHDALDSTLNIVYNEIKYKATLTKEYGDLPMVECMPGKLNQVFLNMLVNAAHAIEDRGRITVRTRVESDEWVVVEIQDTGKGIPEEVRGRIFDPFFTTKTVGEGTGLGLSLSYGIVRDHGGTIEVESGPDEGTCFSIRLPIQQADQKPDH